MEFWYNESAAQLRLFCTALIWTVAEALRCPFLDPVILVSVFKASESPGKER